MSVPVSVIVDRKGSEVVTIPAEASLLTAAEMLTTHNIGALVVSSDGRTVEGVISERDLARQVARVGAAALDLTVAEAMTTDVTTCVPASTVDDLMATMTHRRIRHVPVVVDGRLAGIVSIGDIVRARLDELELQAQALEQYVTGSPT